MLLTSGGFLQGEKVIGAMENDVRMEPSTLGVSAGPEVSLSLLHANPNTPGKHFNSI